MFRHRIPIWGLLSLGLVLAASVGVARAGDKKSKPGKEKAPKAEVDPLRQALDGKTPEQKVDTLNAIVESGKATKDVFFHLGNAKYEANDIAGAAQAFEQAVSMDSTFFKAIMNLGLMYDSQQNYAKAIETFESAARLEPKNPDVWSHMGNTYYGQHDYPKAMELYQKALHLQPKAPHALYQIAVAFAEAGMFREAVNYWKRVVEVDPNGDLAKDARQNIDLLQRYLVP